LLCRLVGMMEEVDVAIAGAGPCGLALAHALLEAGHRVRVYERSSRAASEERPVGAALFIHPFGVNALQAAAPNVLDDVMQLCSPLGRIEIRNYADQADIFSFDIPLEAAVQSLGNPFVTVSRAELCEALLGALAEDVVQFGFSVEGFVESSDAASLQLLSPSGERWQQPCSLVLGADGGRSAIRQQIVSGVSGSGPACSPDVWAEGNSRARQVSPDGWVYYGLTSSSEDASTESATLRLLLGEGRDFLGLDLSRGRQMWSFSNYDQAGYKGSATASERKNHVLDLFEGRCTDGDRLVKELVERTPPEGVVETTYFDVDPLQPWVSPLGRAALVGDAAHCMYPSLAMGTSAAWSDVEHIAASLQDFNAWHNAKLVKSKMAEYEAARKPWVTALSIATRVVFFLERF